ncbi:ammonium transporter [Clostridiales bacterium F-3ap]|uniref:Ammonium transporter n=1 Tax=Anaerotalea alkaliphila TaxID=2662126 RepID=A0A7X5HY83_9FIRM|nr:ammonium transporter [Anaerotalea alkaliphila]
MKFVMDTIWVLVAAALVFFMQAGFAMVETGFTRSKNAGNIIMKNLMDFSVGSVIYWAVGYGLMYGTDLGGFLGMPSFFFSGDYTALIFQTVFCATAATIVSGAMAERTKFSSYLIYSFFISLLVYPISGHWIWGGGWLSQLGFHDFAGSTAVHMLGGAAALVGAYVLGPRLGKYTKDGRSMAIPGHSVTLGALGVFILWFGWFGFNGGSQLAASSVEDALAIGRIFVTTNLAAAMAAIAAMTVTWIRYKKPDVSMTLNGALAGLVAITAGCDVVTPVGAAVIGLLGGVTVVFAIEFVDKVMKVDDPVGAVGVHMVNGALGTVMVGVFAVDGGVLYGGGFGLLGVQALGVVAVLAWTLLTTYIIFNVINLTVGLRVSEKEEMVGLDLEEHGMESYADFQVRT